MSSVLFASSSELGASVVGSAGTETARRGICAGELATDLLKHGGQRCDPR
jgi:hypothetical protein